jgi:hypothetical protein
MRHLVGNLLFLACMIVILVNEGVRIKYGFISDRHFLIFWIIWAFVLAGFGIVIGLLLSDFLPV